MIAAIILAVTVFSSWALITLLQRSISQSRGQQAAADIAVLRRLVSDAVQGSSPQALYDCLIECATRVLAAQHLVIFGFSRSQGWRVVATGSEVDARISRSGRESLSAVAGTGMRCDFADPTRHHELSASEEVGLDELARAFAIDSIIPLAGRGATPLMVGLKLPQPRPARLEPLLDYFRLSGTAAVSVVAVRAQAGKSTKLADQESIRALEESAFADQDDGAADWLDWAAQSQSGDATQWFWSTYSPGEGRVLFVFGQLAASGIAASLLHMSIKSCCDELVSLLPADVEPDQLLAQLNRFLWRPTRPIGMSCHVIAIDREPGGFAIASAGAAIVARLDDGAVKEHSSQLPLLGTSAFYEPDIHADTIAGGEWVLVWSPEMTESAPRSLPWQDFQPPGAELPARQVLDVVASHAPMSGAVLVARARPKQR